MKTGQRKIKIKKDQWLNNYLDATKKKEVDLIVELIGGAEGAAKKLVFNALKNKKHVVTANKALIAKYGDELAEIAEKNKPKLIIAISFSHKSTDIILKSILKSTHHLINKKPHECGA